MEDLAKKKKVYQSVKYHFFTFKIFRKKGNIQMTFYLETGCPNGVAIVAEVHAQHQTPLVVVHILGTLLTPRHETCQQILRL
jgi:hypothetical protein